VLLPEQVIGDLRASGWLWDAGPGLIGLRGPVMDLLREIEHELEALARLETDNEWRTPAGVSFETLERAQYFASFPQWLTAASHLSGDENVLSGIASSATPGAAARSALGTAETVLPPAVCYHTYAAMAGSVIDAPLSMSATGTCWRHEGDRLAALERGWAFTMREIVCLGSERDVRGLLDRGISLAESLAYKLGLEVELGVASDPFFAPTSRGRAALQRIKGLKHELMLRFPDGRCLAIASFNDHERFFGEAFDISLLDGTRASSGCVAFGVERWLLAVLATHGTRASDWPSPSTFFGAVLR
jgi:seryl-tRNA synthetase